MLKDEFIFPQPEPQPVPLLEPEPVLEDAQARDAQGGSDRYWRLYWRLPQVGLGVRCPQVVFPSHDRPSRGAFVLLWLSM
jgi:hypothetical protein